MEPKTAEHLWDEYSESIGETIDDASYWSGRVVMERSKFIKASKEYASQAVRMALEEAAKKAKVDYSTLIKDAGCTYFVNKSSILSLESSIFAKLK